MPWFTIGNFDIAIQNLSSVSVGGSTAEQTVFNVINGFSKDMHLIINMPVTGITGTGGTQTTRIYKGANVVRSQSVTGNSYVNIYAKILYFVAPNEVVKVSVQSSVTTLTGTATPQIIWIDPDQLVLLNSLENILGSTSLDTLPSNETAGTYEHRYKIVFTPTVRVYKLYWDSTSLKLFLSPITVNGVSFSNGTANFIFNNYYVDGIVRSQGGVFTVISGIKIYQIP